MSGKRAPPTFIDDAVEKFRIYEAEKAKNFQNSMPEYRKRHGSGASVSSLPLVETVSENSSENYTSCRNNCTTPSDGGTAKKLDVFNHVSALLF